MKIELNHIGQKPMRFISFRTLNALFGLTVLAVTTVTPVLAQTNNTIQTKSPVHQQHQGFWRKKFNLTPAQKALLKQLHEQQKAALRDILKIDRINKLKAKVQDADRQKLIVALNTIPASAKFSGVKCESPTGAVSRS